MLEILVAAFIQLQKLGDKHTSQNMAQDMGPPTDTKTEHQGQAEPAPRSPRDRPPRCLGVVKSSRGKERVKARLRS